MFPGLGEVTGGKACVDNVEKDGTYGVKTINTPNKLGCGALEVMTDPQFAPPLRINTYIEGGLTTLAEIGNSGDFRGSSFNASPAYLAKAGDVAGGRLVVFDDNVTKASIGSKKAEFEIPIEAQSVLAKSLFQLDDPNPKKDLHKKFYISGIRLGLETILPFDGMTAQKQASAIVMSIGNYDKKAKNTFWAKRYAFVLATHKAYVNKGEGGHFEDWQFVK